MFSSKYKLNGGIYCFNDFTSETKMVSSFYNNFQLDNYKADDDKFSIYSRRKSDELAFFIKNLIGFNKKILDVGAGVCQDSQFFAIGTNNRVYALDPNLSFLKSGKKFSDSNKISNISFINSDIYKPTFKSEIFDLVWCNDVLHHTIDPNLSFKRCADLVKPGGYLFVGLYNRYGMFRSYLYKLVYKLFGYSLLPVINPEFRYKNKISKELANAWFMNQYMHPLKSSHSLDQVFKWFNDSGIAIMSTVPESTSVGIEDLENLKRFTGNQVFIKNKFERIISQLLKLFDKQRNNKELIFILGKKRD